MECDSGMNRKAVSIGYKMNEPWKYAKLKKPVTKVHTYDSTYMKGPEEENIIH